MMRIVGGGRGSGTPTDVLLHCLRTVWPSRRLPFLGPVVTWPVAGTGGRFLVAFWDHNPVQPGIRMAQRRRHDLMPILADPN